MKHRTGTISTLWERAVCAGVFLLPLVCWPDLTHPFSAPKLWLLCAVDLVLAASWLASRKAPRSDPQPAWPWLIWVAGVAIPAVLAPYASFEALLLALLPLPLALALYRGRLSAAKAGQALVWGSAIESLIVLLQFVRLDPFQLLGWHPETFSTRRMRLYGTLGNPDFVAAWLCGTLPLAAALAARRPRIGWPLLAVQTGAILATGSRAAALAVGVMAVAYAFTAARARKWMLAAIPLAAAAIWLSPGRPLRTTVEGRLHLASIPLSHWRDIPIVGYGPGAFELAFTPWQVEWLRAHPPRQSAKLGGPVDHAHNDYVEFLIEYGPVGLCAFLVLTGWLIGTAWRRRGVSPDATARWCGIAGLLAIACVDFPFHRPAEWCLYWLLLGMAAGDVSRDSVDRQGERKNV